MPAPGRAPLAVAAVVAAVALGWRLVGAADWPAPFYQSLQYESALAARTVWLTADARARTPDRAAWLDAAGTQYVTSPPVLPGLVAAVYAATGAEAPWVSRVFTAGFWVAGGALLGAAAARLTGSRWAGAAALAWFVLCPFGMLMSRSFQTEALLVFAFAAATLHLARPRRTLTWRGTLTTGLVCGAAAFVKPGVLFAPLVAGFAAVALPRAVAGGAGRKLAHLAAVAALVVVPGTVYAWVFLRHHGGRVMPRLLLEDWFYAGVARNAWDVVGPALAVGLVGVGMAARARAYLPAALLAGHLATLAVFTFHAATHDYYQVPLLVVTALGLAWPAAWAERWVERRGWARALPAVLLAAAAGYLLATRDPDVGPWRWAPAERARLARDAERRRLRAERAEAIRAAVGTGTPVIELTEGYGYPLRFHGWLDAASWPTAASQFYEVEAAGGAGAFSAEAHLRAMTAGGRPYFVVAHPDEWARQPELRAALARHGPPREPMRDVLVFDLRRR